MGSYASPCTELAQIANEVISKYKSDLKMANLKVHELKKLNDLIFDDYVDNIMFEPRFPHKFRLSYIPEQFGLRLFINGVRYEENVYFIYDEKTNSIEWLFDESNNGFDIKGDMEIIAVYDLNYEKNGIKNKDEFKESITNK